MASPKKTRATRIIGVDAEAERKVTTIPSYTVEGDFFESKVRKGSNQREVGAKDGFRHEEETSADFSRSAWGYSQSNVP